MLAVNEKLHVDRQQIFGRIGYNDDYQPSARITALVNDYIDNYHDLLAPSYSYMVKDILSVRGNEVEIEGAISFKSRVIARLLERCEKVAVFVLTIGNHLEEMVSYLAENKLVLQATVLDAVGSGATENMAEAVADRIKRIAALDGHVTSQRFSPGYCDWKVIQQKMVFASMGPDTAGVRLTKSCLMMPQKSISGIIGIGPAVNNIENYIPCITCHKNDCPGRRTNRE